MSISTYDQVPEDSVLSRHYESMRRMQQARPSPQRAARPAAGSGPADRPGILQRLLGRLFG